MNLQTTNTWAEQILRGITHAFKAHTLHPNRPSDAVRFHDQTTPYFIHPTWCAMTLLSEPNLTVELRQRGCAALLWHDILEDTGLALPDDTPDEVVKLVHLMTFASFSQERVELWQRPSEVKMLKLFDKAANLLDGIWMSSEKWNVYVDHTLRLADEVEQTFGSLNIIRISRAIAVHRCNSHEFIERLVNQIGKMVERSGNKEKFNAKHWVDEWLNNPLPALGGKKPAEMINTREGQEIIIKLLAQSQSGIYC